MKLKLIGVLCFVLVSFISSSDAKNKGGERLVHIGESAELFKKWHRVQDNYTLLTSAPKYQEQDSEEYTRGFRLETSQLLKGKYRREIYDYDIEQSATNVYAQIKKSIKANGYDEIFTCENKDCGDVAGWQLYLSNLVGETDEKQYYLAAKKSPVELKNTEYVAFYISEIDGQVRTLVDIVSTPTRHLFDVVVKTDDMLRTIEKDGRVVVEGIFFDTGSAILKPESAQALESMSQLIKTNENTQFAIVGHADNTGNFDFNMKLSNHRADVVKNALQHQYKVSAEQIFSKGVGTLSPSTSNTDNKGRLLNRRVELIKL